MLLSWSVRTLRCTKVLDGMCRGLIRANEIPNGFGPKALNPMEHPTAHPTELPMEHSMKHPTELPMEHPMKHPTELPIEHPMEHPYSSFFIPCDGHVTHLKLAATMEWLCKLSRLSV